MKSAATPNATSSQASADGLAPSDLPAGQTSAKSGPAPAPANRSPRPAREKGRPMPGTYGPTFIESFAEAGPLSSWENRLRARLGAIGSTEYDLIWRERRTSAGRSISRLAASTRQRSAAGCIGWPAPTVSDHKAGPDRNAREQTKNGIRVRTIAAEISGWPAPRAHEAGPDYAKRTRSNTGMDVAAITGELTGWPAPRAEDGESCGNHPGAMDSMTGATRELSAWPAPQTDSFRSRSGARVDEMGLGQLAHCLGAWPAPTARDHRFANSAESQARRNQDSQRGQQLPNDVMDLVRGWAAPTSLSFAGSHQPGNSRNMNAIREAALAASGTTGCSSGPTAKENTGALSPALICWIQGYDAVWLNCAPSAMPSSRGRRRK